MVKVGFIGTGGMGAYQASSFDRVSGCRVEAGADPSEESRTQFQKAFPAARMFEGHRDLLRDPDVDAVVIAVPTGLHAKVARDALKAGRPTLLEKPMARTVAQCRTILEASSRHGTFLMIAHCRRYDPDWGAMASVIQQGRLGRPVLWRSVSAGPGPGRPWFMDDQAGGGPLLDGCVHNYDFANYMFGDPVSVVSSGIKLNENVTAVDTGTVVVRYAGGDQLMVCWSWHARGLGMSDVLGPKAFLQFGPGPITPPGDNANHRYHCITSHRGDSKLVRHTAKGDAMMDNQTRHFLKCIRGEAECMTPGGEAIKAVAVGEAALRAAPEGQARKVRW
jgi:myo-inositol 2-dehydrogenase/D-chiro-inositol 1-dehydrogenase